MSDVTISFMEMAERAFHERDALREKVSRLTAERDEAVKREKYAISWANRSLDSVKEADDATITKLKNALELIAGHKGKTIYSHDPEYRQGAHDAYEQLADIALTALAPQHASDCAVHNAPALPNGPCDCGATAALPDADRS